MLQTPCDGRNPSHVDLNVMLMFLSLPLIIKLVLTCAFEMPTNVLCNALSNYLIILLEDIVYNYILYDFDDYVTYL